MEFYNFNPLNLSEEQIKLKNDLINELKNDKDVVKFILNNELDESYIEKFPYKFKKWIDSIKICENCPGLHACKQQNKGEVIDLVFNSNLELQIDYCQYKIKQNVANAHLKNYKINHLPESYYCLNLNSINAGKESDNYLVALKLILEWIKNPQKGYYIYGNVGVGKTYLMACLCNYMAKNNHKVAFVHVPTLVSQMKNLFDDNNEYRYMLHILKTVEFCIFDDIGAENVTSWSRDDLLLPILNERMNNQLSTFFTSNLDYKSLLAHYTYDNKSNEEKMKAIRIMERIKALANEHRLDGQNRRND